MTDADLNELCEAVANPSSSSIPLTPFVGSGVSLAATGNRCAGWGGLLSDGIDVCEQLISDLPAGWAERKKNELETADGFLYVSIAEDVVPRLRSIGSGEEVGRWIGRAIGGLRIKPERRELLESVLSLSESIVTTNYDELLEKVAPTWPTWTWTDDDFDSAITARNGIVHLHGVVGKPKSIILSGSDYERLRLHKLANDVTRSIFLGRRFLFIGCGDGLADPNIGPLLTFLNNINAEKPGRKHYLLVLGRELRRFRRDWKWPLVVPIAYGNDFDDLAPFLQKLKNGERINVSQDPRVWERQAADESMSLLRTRRTAEQKIQEAAQVLADVTTAMREVELHSDIPEVLRTWEPDAQEPVHKRKAASLMDAAAHLESCVEGLVSVVEGVEHGTWPLAAPKFAPLAPWVAPVVEKVSDLDDTCQDLLRKIDIVRRMVQLYADLYPGYRGPYRILTHTCTTIGHAADITSSLRSGLSRLQEDLPPPGGRATQQQGAREPPLPSVARAQVSKPAETPAFNAADDYPQPRFRVVPVFEAIGAGDPVEANQNPIDHLALATQLVGEAAYLVLVRGESMTGEDGILENDYVIVDPAIQHVDGDMVAAYIYSDGGGVVKRIRQVGRSTWLESSNPDHEPREYASDDVHVHGIVTGVVRPHVSRPHRGR
ncbi:MAG: SIR2 family protein [Actinobacteria bacterium]|nr:SIR2 family protein [Actinomycetota bacterium]